jgi:hypothetical protein
MRAIDVTDATPEPHRTASIASVLESAEGRFL